MNDTSAGGAAGALALAGINLALGRGAARVHILKDIDLHIGHGEAVGLVGPSGSGKSTRKAKHGDSSNEQAAIGV